MRDNQVVLAGRVRKRAERRYSPAGVAITQLTLQHESERSEAGMSRHVRCAIRVIAAGEPLAETAAGLGPGDGVRVRGYLAWASERNTASLVLHAEHIELLNDE